MEFAWEKPVVIFYRERLDKPERKAFLVVKARKFSVSKVKEGLLRGSIEEFFPLMGDIDYVSSEKGMSDRYVLCWFEDREDDFSKMWRRLTGVTFSNGIALASEQDDKRSYKAEFEAEKGKLK